MRLYAVTHGTMTWLIEAANRNDARSEAMVLIQRAAVGLMGLEPDELKVRLLRDGEAEEMLA